MLINAECLQVRGGWSLNIPKECWTVLCLPLFVYLKIQIPNSSISNLISRGLNIEWWLRIGFCEYRRGEQTLNPHLKAFCVLLFRIKEIDLFYYSCIILFFLRFEHIDLLASNLWTNKPLNGDMQCCACLVIIEDFGFYL